MCGSLRRLSLTTQDSAGVSSHHCHREQPGAEVSRLACILKRWPLHGPPLLVLPLSRKGRKRRTGENLLISSNMSQTPQRPQTRLLCSSGVRMRAYIHTGSAIRSNSRGAQGSHQMSSRAMERKLGRMPPCSAPAASYTTQGLVTSGQQQKWLLRSLLEQRQEGLGCMYISGRACSQHALGPRSHPQVCQLQRDTKTGGQRLARGGPASSLCWLALWLGFLP